MNTARFYHCALSEETLGKIFVIGGYNNGCLKSCESYDIDGDKWTNIAPLNESKQDVSACTFNTNYIYAFGGFNGQKMSNLVEKYDSMKNVWEVVMMTN